MQSRKPAVTHLKLGLPGEEDRESMMRLNIASARRFPSTRYDDMAAEPATARLRTSITFLVSTLRKQLHTQLSLYEATYASRRNVVAFTTSIYTSVMTFLQRFDVCWWLHPDQWETGARPSWQRVAEQDASFGMNHPRPSSSPPCRIRAP